MSLPTTSRASLGIRSLQRANLQYSGFIASDELNQLVNTSVAKLYNQLVGFYEDYFVRKAPYTLQENVADYFLPANTMKLREVFYTDGQGNKCEIRNMMLAELNDAVWTQSLGGWPIAYVLMDDFITIYPRPQSLSSPVQLEIYFVPEYVPPPSDNTQIRFAFANGWDEWVVNDVAIQIRNKAMMPCEELVRERALIEKKIAHEGKQRNAGAPPRVRDSGWGNTSFNSWSQFALK